MKTRFSIKRLCTFGFGMLSMLSVINGSAQSYVLTKNRAPQLHVSEYKQVAIGDIVGPLGSKTEKSLDLTDDLTSKIFNSNVYEVIDRNALAQILSSQKASNISVIDEKTITSLSKQLKNAILITGRLQSDKIEQKSYTAKNGTCPGNASYHWEVTGETALQLKILDVNTGKMIFSNPITVPIKVKSTEECTITQKFDLVPIVNKAFGELATEVSKQIIPYSEQINIVFDKPLVIFKNPFKKLEQVVTFFNVGEFEKGVSILKEFATDNALKDNLKPKAHFNYALGLFCIKDYEQAKSELKMAISLDPNQIAYQNWYANIDKEKELDKKLLASMK